MENKKYFAKTNAWTGMVITAIDDPTVAAIFDDSIRRVEAVQYADCSNIDGMTADQIRFEYPNHVIEGFDPESEEFEEIVKIVKYQIDFYDYSNGATSPIDTVDAQEGYTAEQYIADCEKNANEDWREMLRGGEVIVIAIDD